MKTFSFLLFFAFFYSANSYKILFYNPKFGISHVTFTGKIVDTLAAAGHDVVVYQPVLNENITFTGSKHKSVRYYTMPKNYSFAPHFTLESSQGQIWEEDSYAKMKKMMALMTGVRAGFCELVLNDKENMDKLRGENFDLGITELFESCGLGVFRKLGIKKYITTFGSSLFPSSSALLGIKLHPSYIPGMMLKSTDEMTFIDRVMNIGYYILESYTVATMFTGGTEAVVKKEFPDFTINDAIADSAFYFVNSDEHVDYPQAITHKVIYMAGLGKVQAHPLDKEYTDIFDSAKKGVILFSFGSVVQSSFMKPELKQAFLEAFAEFPDINFLWKYEKDEHQVAKGYKNVFTGKWLPQNDILDHPKLLAFISHGGMNSIMEGSSKGVPMICIPIFADQKRNSFLLQRRGTAIKIDKSEINKENIVAAIKEIINNDKYRKNAKMLSKMVNSKPFSSAERVVKYAEFAAEFGDTGTLQTQGRYQSFIVLYSLDS
uniref:Glucuronosyltransferase n=1 Tax=Panagrolaimus sp. PS1159 TaxID=55785 RepID=A0AC35FPX4_9BILA